MFVAIYAAAVSFMVSLVLDKTLRYRNENHNNNETGTWLYEKFSF